MSYAVSTRGEAKASFAEAVRRGLAPDGGLYLPGAFLAAGSGARTGDAHPDARPQTRHRDGGDSPPDPFVATARRMGHQILGDEGRPWLDAVVQAALDFPTPLIRVEEGLHLLELFHGPTLAFKDVGARFLARSMAALDRVAPESDAPMATPRTVLVATSGDTGGAVADAFHGVPGHRVVALFPRDGISERQRRQMTTLGGNVQALAVEGTFDDCQRLTKEAFADEEVRVARRLTSANSINLGRLLPQTFYYGRAAEQLPEGPAPTWIVPSGNLGNLCAGLLAARVGVPATGFVAALNRNRVLLEYLETGEVHPGPSVPTPSTAMDVGDPSNLERIRALHDDDVASLAQEVRAHSVGDEATYAMMERMEREHGSFVDPHTAVGLVAWERAGRPRPAVVLATAHPAKFPEQVRRATGREAPLPDRLAAVLKRPEHQVSMGSDYADFRRFLLDDGEGS